LRLLLDTHVALWAITDHPGLSAKARELILAPDSTIWVSAVTVWEISIKSSLGRGEMPVSGKHALEHFRQAG
jgi:PIN domain nuclease of toxin-antitoxin system